MNTELTTDIINEEYKQYCALSAKEVRFKNSNGLRPFTNICLESEKLLGFEKHWKEAIDINDFKRRVFADKALIHTQGYAELSKESKGHEHRVQEMCMSADKTFTVYSDIGSVLVGCSEFSFAISHSGGDGGANVAIFNKRNCFNSNMISYLSCIEGTKIDVHEYDCDINSPVLATLSGRYGVYAGYGVVIFEKWE